MRPMIAIGQKYLAGIRAEMAEMIIVVMQRVGGIRARIRRRGVVGVDWFGCLVMATTLAPFVNNINYLRLSFFLVNFRLDFRRLRFRIMLEIMAIIKAAIFAQMVFK